MGHSKACFATKGIGLRADSYWFLRLSKEYYRVKELAKTASWGAEVSFMTVQQAIKKEVKFGKTVTNCGKILTIYRCVLKLTKRVLWGKWGYSMSKKRSLYNEIKATQVACLLLKLNGGEMDYAKCIKLLYSIEREALNRWIRPVIYDDLYSLPYGQVVSKTLDMAEYRERRAKSFWGEHLENYDGTDIRLIKECGRGKLSRAEINLIEEIFEENKDKTPEQLFQEHHNPALFPEYKDPQGSRIETTYSDLLRILGKPQEQIQEFEEDMNELAYLEEMTQ